MSDTVKTLITFAFITAIVMLVFVRAGQNGGKSGGEQVATMANAIGGAFGGIIQSSSGQKL